MSGSRYDPPPQPAFAPLPERALKLFDPIPLRAIPPNAVTATALMCGLASIWHSLHAGDLYRGAWLVLWSVLLDKLDGSLARAFKGSSEFGVQFDSFADCISFGAAPAALIYAAASQTVPQVWGPGAVLLGLPAQGVLAGVCLTYAVMTAVRLARFNVTTAAIGPHLFLGLPSTLSGALICAAYLTYYELGWNDAYPQALAYAPALLAVNAALMVCNLPLPKFKLSKVLPIKVFQGSMAVLVYVLIPLQKGFWFTLAVLLAYIAIGFAWLGPKLYAEQLANPQPAED